MATQKRSRSVASRSWACWIPLFTRLYWLLITAFGILVVPLV